MGTDVHKTDPNLPKPKPHNYWPGRIVFFGVLAILGCCAFLVYGVNQGGKITDATKTALAGTQLVQRSWTATASLTPVPTGTPTIAPTPTESPTPTETLTPLPTLPPKTQTALAQSAASTALAAAKTAVVAASLTASAASPTPSQTPSPTPTDDPNKLSLSLPDFIDKYNGMTDLQKNDFRASLPGKTVAWSGNVFDVSGDGAIQVDIPGTLVSLVDLKGVPRDQAAKVNKNTIIKFTGTIQSVLDFLGLHVYLVGCQIVP